MKLEFDGLDLRSEYRGDNGEPLINVREVSFDKLSDEAQDAARAAGEGMYYSWDRKTREMIVAPELDMMALRIEIVIEDKDSAFLRIGDDRTAHTLAVSRKGQAFVMESKCGCGKRGDGDLTVAGMIASSLVTRIGQMMDLSAALNAGGSPGADEDFLWEAGVWDSDALDEFDEIING